MDHEVSLSQGSLHTNEDMIYPYLSRVEAGPTVKQESLYYQPKQCIGIREITQIYHRFVSFDLSKMGNLMIPL